MSLIARVRHRFSYASIGPCLVKPTGLTRHFAQAAARAEDEVEIDQRRLPTDYDPATTFDPTEHRSPPTERVWRLVDEISGLTLAETAELSSITMRKLGMKETPVVGVMKPSAAAAAAGVAVIMEGVSEEEAEKIID